MDPPKKDYLIPQRLIVALMAFLGIVSAYTMRLCLSVAIVDLVPPKNHTAKNLACEATHKSKEINSHYKYDWSEQLQGYILAAFFAGYIIMHIPGGYLADIFGAKWIYGGGLLISGICTLITPIAIQLGGGYALIVVRFLMGLSQGPIFPAAAVLLAKWAPLSERAKVGAFILGAGPVGTVLSNTLSGFIVSEISWQASFYFFGVLTIIWFIAFAFLCYNTPQEHKFIKPGELEYLEKEMGVQTDSRKLKIPWLAIFTNVPVIVLIIHQAGHDFGLFAMVTDLPKYMADVIGFSIKETGVYSSFPYILMWISTIACGFLADWLIKTEKLTLYNERNLMTGIAAVGPAVFMVAASYAGCNRILVIILFTISMGLMGTYYSGLKLAPVDLSPNFSGTLMALSNGVGALGGFGAPTIIGYMTPDSTLVQWRGVFWLAFAMFVGTFIIYLIWTKSDVQDFNDPDYQAKKEAAKAAKA